MHILTIASTVSAGSVTVELHHPANLTCDWKCSGLLKWSFKYHEVLAECDQSSCRSEEGFNISHDQYLKGNPHLTITAAEYTTRGLYTCQCDGKDVCNVRLIIQTVEMTRVITPGEPVDVYLPLTDLVEVSFTASDAEEPSNLQICTVDNEKIHCSPDYKERAYLHNILQIKDGRDSDSGIYTVQDKVNDEILAIINVHMRGCKGDQEASGAVSEHDGLDQHSVHSEEKSCQDRKQERSMPAWEIALIVMLFLAIVVLIGVMVYLVKRKTKVPERNCSQRLCTEPQEWRCQYQQQGRKRTHCLKHRR